MTVRRLGPFKCGDSIGAGGMSEVFRARHDTTGDLVAIKVTHFGPLDDRHRQAFAAEIAAMARVYHPGIVSIHDWGVLPDGRGNWCAMDWAPLGSLKLESINSWEELRSLLTQVLDALGHAHARGIVHRDLKPDNVLVYDEPAGQQYRLADFGLAYSRVRQDDTKAMGAAAGTPAYMAPEQIYGLWREFGPWTDLYALGCMAFEFATGRPPFGGRSPLDIALAHIKEPLPALAPRFAVPDGLEAWVRALLDRDWGRRPRNAIAARAALETLGDPRVSDPALVDVLSVTSDMPVLEPTLVIEALQSLGLSPDDTLDSEPRASEYPSVPIPADWRTAETAGTRFGDVGLRLFELRQVAIVGQEQQRDVLWDLLNRTVSDGATQVVLIEGEPESDCRLILDWFLCRIRECTTLPTVRLDLSAELQHRDPFREAIETILVSRGLVGARLHEHLGRVLRRMVAAPESMSERVAEVLAMDAHSPVSKISTRTLFAELIDAASEIGPLVLAVEGLERDPAAWFLVERLKRFSEHPVLVVLRPAPPDWSASESETLVRTKLQTSRVSPEPLGSESSGRVLDAYIQLDPSLRARYVKIASETPTLALDILRHSIRQGALKPTGEGYRLRDGFVMPETLGQLVAGRLAAIREESPEAVRILSAAVAMGPAVSLKQWRELASRVGTRLDRRDVELLMRHDFVQDVGGRYVFEAKETRSLLLSRARPEDLTALLDTWGGDTAEWVLRKAELQLARHAPEAAAESLIDGLSRAGGEDYILWHWVPLATRVAQQLPAGHHLSAWILVAQGRAMAKDPVRCSLEWVEETLGRDVVRRAPAAELELEWVRMVALALQRRLDESEALGHRILDSERGRAATRFRGEVLGTLGWVLIGHGEARFHEAQQVLQEALLLLEDSGATAAASVVALHLALVPAMQRDEERTFTAFQRAEELARASKVPARLPRVFMERSTVCVLFGRYDDAVQDAETAQQLGAWGLPAYRGVIGVNLAICLGHAGEFLRAEAALVDAERLALPGQALNLTQFHAVRCVLAALAGDTERWQQLQLAPEPEPQLGLFAQFAATAWDRHGDAVRAAEAREYLSPRSSNPKR